MNEYLEVSVKIKGSIEIFQLLLLQFDKKKDKENLAKAIGW